MAGLGAGFLTLSLSLTMILRANHHHTTGPVFAPHRTMRG
jgi:hypothetical protein